MNIIGISFGYHDSAVALIMNGICIFSDHEERYTGIKNDNSFPIHSLTECMKIVDKEEIDAIVYYENSILKLDRIIKSSLSFKNFYPRIVIDAMVHWYKNQKFNPSEKIFLETKICRKKIHFTNHHQSHAASAFYLSSFEKSAIITIDGVGEWETATISCGNKNKIEKVKSVHFPHSIGLFYSAFTSFLGFEVNDGEYKVMGMSAYGEPRYYEKIKKLVTFKEKGQFLIDQSYFDFVGAGDFPFNNKFIKEFGYPRKPESDLIESYYCDIASSVQLVTEELILKFVNEASNLVGSQNICFAGGVALNSSANGRIIRETDHDLFVPPVAGDAGGAIGAALHYYYKKNDNIMRKPLSSPFLGREFKEDDYEKAIKKSYLKKVNKFTKPKDLIKKVAEELSKGKVIGWFSGAAEIGPRALGARSILADPRGIGTQDMINEKIKFREKFRPFAPSVLAEEANNYFEIDRKLNLHSPENYMLAIANVREKYRDLLPAVTHVNNTARVQTVHKEHNENFYNLIKEFKRKTGIPILLNTSFNLRGEPIVGAPDDAITTFLSSNIDCLVLGNFIIGKDK